MKQRITYIRGADQNFDPASIAPTGGSLKIPSLRAAKEHKLTIDVSELPEELVQSLKDSQRLRLRWTSAKSYDASGPFASRLTPGLHILWTPDNGVDALGLCNSLEGAFAEDIACHSKRSFSTASSLSPNPAASTAQQFYALVKDPTNLTSYIQRNVCRNDDPSCRSATESLTSAAYIDLDYDATKTVLVATAYWSKPPNDGTWSETVTATGKAYERVEVGILHTEASEEPSELRLGGWLTVLGDDSKPSRTLFSFPSRHHAPPSTSSPKSRKNTYATTFDTPTGLHPTLRLTFLTPPTAPQAECRLLTYLTLPASLFIDRHPLSDALTLASHNLTALHSLTGATDLEAPLWTVQMWGSAALFELASPPPSLPPPQGGEKKKSNEEFVEHTATIPLHLRYLSPTPGGYTNTTIPSPIVFWACPRPSNTDTDTDLTNNPFDRHTLGYDALFPANTLFYHLQPDVINHGFGGEGLLVQNITVPVLDLSSWSAGWVDVGTAGVVFVGFAWVCWCLFRPVGGKGEGGGDVRDEGDGEEDVREGKKVR